MEETAYAYLAGIVDGEGTVTLIKKGKRNRYPLLVVSSTTYEILDYLKSTFGGYICLHKKSKNKHKQAWSWRVDYGKSIELLSKCIQYMKEPEKIRRGNLILGFYKDITKRNGWYTEEEIKAKEEFEIEFFKNSNKVKLKSVNTTANRVKSG